MNYFDNLKPMENNIPRKKKEIESLNIQVGGEHYKNCKIEPVEYIVANNIGFCEGNIIKYVTRHKEKNGLQDLLKARHYINILIELATAQQVDKIKYKDLPNN